MGILCVPRELISVIVPTKNSAETILQCIRSIKDQTYENVEIIVVDSKSTDSTESICKQNQVQFLSTDWKLLGARLIGFQQSLGDYVLMLDSDQTLEKTCLERCAVTMNEYDMLCLEEKTLETSSFIQRAFEADRRLIHAQSDIQLDPIDGTLLARFYKRHVLSKAFDAIPAELLPFVIAHDHAIIYYEARKTSNRVGIIPNAVWHNEPKSVGELWRKNRRYGRTSKELANTGFYSNLVSKKTRLRKSRGLSRDKVLSSLLLILKAPAYIVGYYFG
jgi:glycosyltransferase involved in cell wall biosynthesis